MSLEPGQLVNEHAIEQARELAHAAHRDQVDLFGLPLIDHAFRVAAAVRPTVDDVGMVAAVLHDAVERGSASFGELLAAGVDPAAVAIVDLLTKRAGEATEAYLGRCASHPVARVIKRADLVDKLDPARLALLPQDDADELGIRIAAQLATLDSYA